MESKKHVCTFLLSPLQHFRINKPDQIKSQRERRPWPNGEPSEKELHSFTALFLPFKKNGLIDW